MEVRYAALESFDGDADGMTFEVSPFPMARLRWSVGLTIQGPTMKCSERAPSPRPWPPSGPTALCLCVWPTTMKMPSVAQKRWRRPQVG